MKLVKNQTKKGYSNLQDSRVKQQPKLKLGQLVRTADIEGVFSKGGSTNYSYQLYKIPEVLHDTLSSYRIDYLPERCDENLLHSTKLSLDESNQVLKKLNSVQ